ncbi:MAG: hypothetical protein KDI21_21805, partial [Halieaceae bacterium]|nr:hypothetical protein [Halieaceae bacterium]
DRDDQRGLVTEQIPIPDTPMGDVMDAGAGSLALATGQIMAGMWHQLQSHVVALNVEAIDLKAFPQEAIERRMDNHKAVSWLF